MQIHKLILEDFGTIDKATIIPSKGINLISGGNGQGKSTILKAIVLALFGYSKEKLEDLIKWDKGEFYIELEFEHLGLTFTEEISYSKKIGTQKSLAIKQPNESQTEMYRDSEATNKLKEFFDPKLSLASIVSYEGEVDLITVRPSERREHLKKIYNLDFKHEIDDIDVLVKDFEKKRIETDTELNILLSKTYNYEQVSIDRDSLDFDPSLINSKTEELNGLQEQLEGSKNGYSKAESEFGFIVKSEKEDKDKLDSLVKSTSSVKTERQARIIKLEGDIQVLIKSIDDAKNSNEQSRLEKNSKLEKLNSEILGLSSRKSRVPVISDDEKKIYDDNMQKYQDTSFELKDVEKQLSFIKAGKCPTCGRDYSSSSLKDYEDKQLSLKNELDDLIIKIESFKKKQDECESIEKSNKEIEAQIKDMEFSIKSLTESIVSDKEKYDLICSNNDSSLQNKTHQLEDEQKELERLSKEHEDFILQLNALDEKNRVKKTELVTQMEIFRNDMIEKAHSIDGLKTSINLVQQYINQKKLIDDMNKKIDAQKLEDSKKANSIRDLLIDTDNKIDNYKKAKSILQKEFPAYVIETLIEELESEINRFLQNAYSRYELKIREEKDSLNIFYGENEKDVSLASGYEKQVFSIAYKMALASLQSLGFAIFDEIDSQASEENSILLYETIARIGSDFDQIFVITHRENTKDYLKSEYGSTVFEVQDGKILKE